MRGTTPLGPGGRPLRGLRLLPTLLGLGVFAANAVILLSDRAPGLFRRLSVRIDAGVARAADAAGAPGAAADARIAHSDFPVHVALWAAAALLVGLAAWSWPSLVVGAVGVLAVSAGMEAAQGLYSSTRTVQPADVAANAVGVGVGVLAAAVLAIAWRPRRGRA